MDVIDIVSGDHADYVLDGFLSTLGMLSVVLPLIGGKRLEERKVCFAHDAVQFDGFAGIAFFVVSGGDPGILIVGLNGGSRGSEDGAHAPSDYDFDIGEVSQDFGDGPFLRRGALPEFGGGDSFNQAIEFFRGGGLDFERVLSPGIGQDALRILLSGFRHLESPSCFAARVGTGALARPSRAKLGSAQPPPNVTRAALHEKYISHPNSKSAAHATASLNFP